MVLSEPAFSAFLQGVQSQECLPELRITARTISYRFEKASGGSLAYHI
jgi:hypothetical protein